MEGGRPREARSVFLKVGKESGLVMIERDIAGGMKRLLTRL